LVSEFDTVRGTQTTEWITKLGAIKIKQEAASQISAEESREALINFLRTVDGHNKLPFTEQHQELQARAAWALTISPKTAIPELSDNALRESQPFWLAQFLPKDLRLSSIKAQDITNALNGLLSWSGKRDLDKLAPDTFQLPSGKSAPIRYAQNGEPTLEVVIQHAFGLRETPLIGELKKPLCLHLLSPARRPMQVTRDLASFWRSTYPEVRKELRGRYPKHRWPEDPNSD
jgi:ATP-dependent helicase HrpB